MNLEGRLSPFLERHGVRGAAGALIRGERLDRAFIGHMDGTTGPAPNGRTVFEIGSITKTFTGLLLAEMAVRGDVTLDARVAEFAPTKGGATLVDLAAHTSGLPRDPTDDDDYWEMLAGYTTAHLTDDVTQGRLVPGSGRDASYSNLGYGLLGLVLAIAGGEPYEDLVQHRITEPLRMPDTGLRAPHGAATATGHDEDGTPVGPFRIPGLAAAGALRSTLDDMLRYATAMLRPEDTSITEAIELATAPRASISMDGNPGEFSVGLGWIIERRGGVDRLWHNGGTQGFGSYLALEPEHETAAVLLTNAAHQAETDEALAALMDDSKPGRKGVAKTPPPGAPS